MGKLTAKRVESLKLKPGRYQDGNGLTFRVKRSLRCYWSVRVQVNGQRREFTVGTYPDVGLAKAREEAVEKQKQFRSGIDPSEAKKRSEGLKTAIPTFREAANSAHKDRKDGWKNEKHRAQWLSSLETYAFPAIGDMRVDQIEATNIIILLRPIWLKKPETARRVRQRVGAVLNWANANGFRPTEAPTRAIGMGLPLQPKKERHFEAVPWKQVPEVVKTLSSEDSVGRLALRFLILTAARSGEVRGATWDEINWEEAIWTVPAERMKAGRQHVVPLSPAALEVLEAVKALRTGKSKEPIFPGLRRRPLSDMTLTKVLRNAISSRATVHGFRSSFRDWAAEKKDVRREVAEAALAHTIRNKAEAAYRRTDYLKERRALMARWGAFVTGGLPTGKATTSRNREARRSRLIKAGEAVL